MIKYSIKEDFELQKNYFLKDLKGFPQEIGGNLDIRECISLDSLDHGLKERVKILGDIRCDDKWTEEEIMKHFDVRGSIDNKYVTRTFGLLLHEADLKTTREILARKDIDPNDIDPETKCTPLHIACAYKYKVALELLKDPRIDINKQSLDSKKTPFMICATHNQVSLIDLLLADNKLNLNLTDSEGNTALIQACKDGYSNTVEKILKRIDVDVNILNNREKTALDYSLHSPVRAELLKKRGAKTGVELIKKLI